MKKAQCSSTGTINPVRCVGVESDSSKPMAFHLDQALEPAPHKKGWWARYVARLKKHEGDVRSCCR